MGRRELILGIIMILPYLTKAQTPIYVHLNVEHSVHGVSEFDRSKFVVLHAGIDDNEWDSDEQRAELLEGYDVYLGRNNGSIVWDFNQVAEDPLKAGWPSVENMIEMGNSSKTSYAAKTSAHVFEHRTANMLIGGQSNSMYPHGQSTNPSSCCSNASPWIAEGYEAMAEYYAHYIKDYFGTGSSTGKQVPTYLEVLNEPFVHSNELGTTNANISEMHKVVAQRVKELNPDIKVGGYTAAHPAFESNDFGHWNSTWKTFMDIAGADVDFYSVHFYDFRRSTTVLETQRKGSNIEAIMDMMEHYQMLTFGEKKPFLISEYGYLLDQPTAYSKVNDWYHIRTFNSMMIQTMERQDQMLSSIPFMILKALWGTSENGIPYGPRLLRQKKEVPGFEGNGEDWVYTEFIKYFELWENVNGTRIDTYSADPDLLVDAYVENNKVYLILNNLVFEPKTIDINMFDDFNASILDINVKHLYANQSVEPVLDEYSTSEISQIALDEEATMILEYTFDGPVQLTENTLETKVYANKYLQSIITDRAINFGILGVNKGDKGEALLRVGLGRDHGLSLSPTITVNGTQIQVPTNWKGDDQRNRDSFFGVIEMKVPYNLLDEDNAISITFPDNGGFVSSLSLQAFEHSTDLNRPEEVLEVDPNPSQGILIYPNPAQDQLNIRANQWTGMVQCKIYDTKGQLMISERLDVNEPVSVSIQSLTQGLYITELNDGNQIFRSKLIVR
ncbi:MAG: T9SS type A sorting domain-containing protein [Reichenbachiella sp.]